MQRTTSGAAGNGLYTTIKYMRGASGIGMGTTTKHLRRTTSGAAGNGLGATMKYLRCTTSAAANFWHFWLTIQNTANRQVRNLFLKVSWLYLSRFAAAAAAAAARWFVPKK
jgi:hypothetical protein